MLLYRIKFEVDDGVWHDKDVALVMAHNTEEAVEKLRSLINSIDSETCVSRIFKTEIFNGEVFTGNHGWR